MVVDLLHAGGLLPPFVLITQRTNNTTKVFKLQGKKVYFYKKSTIRNRWCARAKYLFGGEVLVEIFDLLNNIRFHIGKGQVHWVGKVMNQINR